MTVLDITTTYDAHWINGDAASFTNSDFRFYVGEFGFGGATYSSLARFPGITIPQSAVIDTSYVMLNARANRSSTVSGIWAALDEDNPVVPSTYSAAISAPSTTAAVPQTYSNVTGGNDYSSGELATIVGEIVTRPGWSSGNDMVFFCDSENVSGIGFIDFNSMEGSSANAAQLHIEYTTNTAPTITVAPTVTYGSLTRLGPNNTPAAVTFTATDDDGDALTYEIRTAASGAGTLIGSGSATSGVADTHNIANADPGLVDGSQTLYLRIHDGTDYSADSSFTLLRDTGAPTVGTITTNPSPVTN